MSAPTRPSTLVQGRAGRLLGAAVALSLIGTSLVSALPAQADTSVKAQAGNFTIRGAGFGHGWGMSQYGAYGAARKGLTWKKILAFYYPGTKLKKMSGNTVAQGVGDRRLRRQPPGAAGQRPEGPRRRRRHLQGADRVEVQVLADQPVRVGIPAQPTATPTGRT